MNLLSMLLFSIFSVICSPARNQLVSVLQLSTIQKKPRDNENEKKRGDGWKKEGGKKRTTKELLCHHRSLVFIQCNIYKIKLLHGLLLLLVLLAEIGRAGFAGSWGPATLTRQLCWPAHITKTLWQKYMLESDARSITISRTTMHHHHHLF